MRVVAFAIALVFSTVGCREGALAPASVVDPGAGSSDDAQRSLVAAPLDSACGTAAVDGTLSPGEWDSAVSARFAVALPESAGGGEVPGTFQAMSDGENLYFAFRLEADVSRFAPSFGVEFDADLSMSGSQGDDGIGLSYSSFDGTVRFGDEYRYDCVGDGHPAICSIDDTGVLEGLAPPGTTDGGGAISFDGTSTVVEMWHPYRGADPRDLHKAPGDVVPLMLGILLIDTCADWPRCAGGYTAYPADGFRYFAVGCGPPPDETVVGIRIEVTPGDALPTIHRSSGGTVAVAILGSETFRVADVDVATVYFAGAPVSTGEGGSFQASLQDRDGDGHDDLVVHFETSSLVLSESDVEATLAGRTSDGHPFKGTDVVRVVP